LLSQARCRAFAPSSVSPGGPCRHVFMVRSGQIRRCRGGWRMARRFPAVGYRERLPSLGLPGGGRRVVRGGCTSLGAHPGSKRRLAWSRDCDDYEGMVVALLLVAAIAAIWWLVGHKGWGAVQKVVFWVVLLAILWVVVTRYSAPHPGG
jgi:hypothetical protein